MRGRGYAGKSDAGGGEGIGEDLHHYT
jgi:hypothetical protein